MNDNASGLPVGGPNSDDDDSDPDIGLSLECVRLNGDWSSFEPLDDLIASLSVALSNSEDVRLGETATATLVLSSDQHVRVLNNQYRGHDRPTNVLSFAAPALAQDPDGEQSRFLGDVIVAQETVLREAVERNVPAAHHLAHLVVHGVLHLLGHDHRQEPNARVMEQIETTILGYLGIGDPYSETEHDNHNNRKEAVDCVR